MCEKTAFRLLLFLCFLLIFLTKVSVAVVSDEILKKVKEDLSDINLSEQKYSLIVGTGITLGAFFADDEIKRSSEKWKSEANNAISDFGNFAGHPLFDFSISALFYASSKKDSVLEKASFTALESVFFATLSTEVIAYSVGRKRPYQSDSSTDFAPFSGKSSFPSAHSASSMAFFSSYARYYGAPYSYFFYSIPVATAFGRIYENRHYFSDVIMGGTIGFVTSSYLYERHKKKEKQTFIPLIFANDKNVFVGFSKYF